VYSLTELGILKKGILKDYYSTKKRGVRYDKISAAEDIMTRLITKKEALAFKRRWEIVNEAERQELRKTSPSKKLHQLTTLMAWVKDFGWDKTLKAEETEVRERWVRLKRLYHV
jgi:hypothetical protein